MSSLIQSYVVTKDEDPVLPWKIIEQPEPDDRLGRLIERFPSLANANTALEKMASRRAAIVVITDGKQALVSRRAGTAKIYADAMQYPGGKADDGETIRACAQRELREETGIAVPRECLGYVGCLGVPPGGRYEGHGFILLVESPDFAQARQTEPQNAGPWVPMALSQLMTYAPGSVIPGFLTLTAMVREYIDRYRMTTRPTLLGKQ